MYGHGAAADEAGLATRRRLKACPTSERRRGSSLGPAGGVPGIHKGRRPRVGKPAAAMRRARFAGAQGAPRLGEPARTGLPRRGDGERGGGWKSPSPSTTWRVTCRCGQLRVFLLPPASANTVVRRFAVCSNRSYRRGHEDVLAVVPMVPPVGRIRAQPAFFAGFYTQVQAAETAPLSSRAATDLRDTLRLQQEWNISTSDFVALEAADQVVARADG